LKLEDCKVIFATAGLIGILLFASPTLSLVFRLPSGEKFSELWILGPNHMIEDYPFNVKANEAYGIYVGVSNHMASSSYYVIKVKFRNQTEPLPDSSVGIPSPLQALYEYYIIIQNDKTFETYLTFSFPQISRYGNQCLVEAININDVMYTVHKPASWNVNYTGYFYQLFFELWIYDVETEAFQFHNRFVNIWLNMTSPM